MKNKLTFEELELGDKFICFPEDGDNNGHGGYKITHWVFKKAKKGDEYFGIRLIDSNHSSFPNEMEIIKVK